MPEDKVMVSPELETVVPDSQAEKSVSVKTAISAPEITEKSLKPFRVKEQPLEIAQYPNAPADVPNLPPMPGVTSGGSPGASGVMVPNPEVIIRSSGTPANPSIIYPTVPVAPVLPRAVAPPVGDMSISNINTRFDPVDLGPAGQAIVPRLVLRQAPVREVLLVLARYAGVNVIFTDSDTPLPDIDASKAIQTGSSISLDIENQPVQEVFNSVLMVARLKASKRGNTVFIGSKLPQEARNLITRTIRLNQAQADSAASYLSLQGAQTNLYRPASIRRVYDQRTGQSFEETVDPRIIPIELDETRRKSLGATPLEGLLVATDPRLNSVTLVGEPRLIEIATSLLTQLDARRRQVAINVKIVDINLNNIQDYKSSFSFGYEDSYFVQDRGTAVMRFGETAPLSSSQLRSAVGGVTNPPLITNPLNNSNVFLDYNNPITIPSLIGDIPSVFFPSAAAISTNPATTGLTSFTPATSVSDGTTNTITAATANYGLPSYFQYPKRFQAQVEAQIRTGNAKILTDPTLFVQEGQEAQVKLTESVVSSVNTQVDPLSGVRTTTPVLSDVGLTLQINVERIDDNGFISLSVKPTVASPGGQQQFESGPGANNTITLINKRELSSGLLRLRDGQTLIMSGIITQIDQTLTSKVPILGDLPVIGALFRSQTDQTDRSEVVVMLTPQVISDNTESQFGYNYTPGRATADYLRQQGFPVQAQP
ncbi:MAG: secretin N-terminal domain-containing protein [Merismopediaceae bacterium]|nr:secretin N-terminal domain-containing protein [Merismopediaceae bacterium]